MAFLVSTADAAFSNEHLNSGYKRSNIISSACSGFEVWWNKFPGKLIGKPATGKLYRSITKKEIMKLFGPNGVGEVLLEQHSLTRQQSQFFSKLFRGKGDAGVPFVVSIGANFIPGANVLPSLGVGIIDFILKKNSGRAKAIDVGVLMQSGGEIQHSVAVRGKQGRQWIAYMNTFQTTVNTKTRRYLLCTLSYPLQVVAP